MPLDPGDSPNASAPQLAQATLDALPEHICVLDDQGTVLLVNRAWREFGRENGAPGADGFLGYNYLEVCARATGREQGQARAWRAGLLDVIAGRQETVTLEYPCHAPGRERWFACWASRFVDQGRTRVVVSHADLTASKEMERALRRSEERLALVLKGSNDASWDWDLERGELVYSPRWWELLGLPLAEHTTDPGLWGRLLHPDDKARVEQVLAAALADGPDHYEVEFRLRHRDGHFVPVLSRGFVLRGAAGKAIRVSGTNTDLTERERAARQLREAAELLSLFIQRSPIYAYVKEVSATESRVLHVSENYQQMLGRPISEMIGKTMQELFPAPLAAQMTADDLEVVSSGQVRHIEEENAGCSYTSVKFPIVLGPGRTLLAGYTIDVTEQRRAEAARKELLIRTARAERGAALGTIAAGMSHEINNPLTYVTSGISFALEQLGILGEASRRAWAADVAGGPGAVEEALREAEEGALRVRDLVADLRAFSSGQHSPDATCDLASAIRRGAKMAQYALAEGACLAVELPPLPSVAGSEAELGQLFCCLLVNAYQATSGAPNLVRVTAEQRGATVVTRVSDTGRGISPEHLPRAFEPFFTTRPVGQGKGLGLSVALGIAQGLGGSVELQSEVGQGTTVTVTLPVPPA